MTSSYPDLYEEVPQMFFECWKILIKTKQTLNEEFDLSSEIKHTHIITMTETFKSHHITTVFDTTN